MEQSRDGNLSIILYMITSYCFILVHTRLSLSLSVEMMGAMKTAGLRTPTFALVLVTLVTVVWAYWTTLAEVAERWTVDPQYSHGFLVPIFAGCLLWMRRRHLAEADLQPRWWGVGVVLIAAVMRIVGHFLYQPWLDTGSFLICLAGIVATAGGKRGLVWAGPAILFLSFMLPLPYRMQTVLGGTLQRIATEISTYAIQTIGVPAVSEGNVILLTDTKLGVVEACNGLSMLITFFALSTAVAILTKRSFPEKVVIVLSALPIAIFANVARITVTGLLYEVSQGDLARVVFHDLAGWLMMPLALAMLLVELSILERSVEPVRHTAHGKPAKEASPKGASSVA
jgi:exosortase